jgi:hypothetical protein
MSDAAAEREVGLGDPADAKTAAARERVRARMAEYVWARLAPAGMPPPSRNAFCPTGPGGGIDPTCSPGGGGKGGDVAEVKPQVEKELRNRPAAAPEVDIPALVEDHGPAAKEALLELRREGKVRLLAIGGPLIPWLKQNGYTRDQVIDGEGEVFIQAEWRRPAANAFCPTGPGGGIDPTCSPGGVRVPGAGSGVVPNTRVVPATVEEVAALPGVRRVKDREEGMHSVITDGGEAGRVASALRARGWDVVRLTEHADLGFATVKAFPLEERPRPDHAYHLVPRAALESVLGRGLLPGAPERSVKSISNVHGLGKVFLTDNPGSVELWRKEFGEHGQADNVLLRVDLRRVRAKAYRDHAAEADPGSFYLLGKAIPAGTITHVEGEPVRRRGRGRAANAFCPTGPGGGVDPSCSPGGGGNGGGGGVDPLP